MSMEITRYFAADHDRLDSILEACEKEMISGGSHALDYFLTFRNGLKKHIEWEEHILFPLFENKSNFFNMGPTQVMRFEHQKIINIMTQMEMILANKKSDPDLFLDLKTILHTHNTKEENILYPSIDEKITQSETADIFSAMEEFSNLASDSI